MHLSELSHPNELHGLSIAELETVAAQIREKHLKTVSTSGGHLGPGLGVVELTLALYQTLDLDHDRVVWDVGHQAYPHKLITGRFGTFNTLRQQSGVAGYLKRIHIREPERLLASTAARVESLSFRQSLLGGAAG